MQASQKSTCLKNNISFSPPCPCADLSYLQVTTSGSLNVALQDSLKVSTLHISAFCMFFFSLSCYSVNCFCLKNKIISNSDKSVCKVLSPWCLISVNVPIFVCLSTD